MSKIGWDGTRKDFEDILYKNFQMFQEDQELATELYSALCNIDWLHVETGQCYNCSWRYAGDLVASIRHMGEDYMDYYCSGNEGQVSTRIEEFLAHRGWKPLQNDEIHEVYEWELQDENKESGEVYDLPCTD